MVFRDSDTGAMAAMPVFETSFTSLGVSLSATAPRQETSSEPSSLPPQDAHDRSAPSRRNYSQRSPSPQRDHYRRSPSPRRGYSRRSPSPRLGHLRRSPSPQREYHQRPPSPRRESQRRPPSPRSRGRKPRPPLPLTRDSGWSQRRGNPNYEGEQRRDPRDPSGPARVQLPEQAWLDTGEARDAGDPQHTWGASSSGNSPGPSASSPTRVTRADDAFDPPTSAPSAPPW